MGCASSKLDDLPAVALCRDRCDFLDEAIRQRYVLSQSHLAYILSLKNVGASLHRFFDRDLDHFAAAEPPSPVVNIPAGRKGIHPQSSLGSPNAASSPVRNLPANAAADHHRHAHSNSGSHLRFHSDDDDDEEESDDDDHHHHDDDDSASGSFHHHLLHDQYSDGPSSPLPQYGHLRYSDSDSLPMPFPGSFPTSYPTAGGTFMHMNFMRNQTTPSVSYQQRPISPEIVRMGGMMRMGEASSSHSNSSSYYSYPFPPQPNPNQNPNFVPPTIYNYSSYGTGSGFPGSSAAPYYGSPSLSGQPIGASSSKEPPPPPSPPQASAWEFLNPFETYDKYYPPYTPSRDSKELREEEGIPDLEEDDYQQEVVKEIQGDQKFVDGSSGAGGVKLSYSKPPLEEEEEEEEDGNGGNSSEALYRTRPRVGMDVESELHMVGKKVVDDEERSAGLSANVAGFKARGAAFKGDSEVIREIQFQFERASESGNELAKILEVGKLPYNRKHSAYQAKVSSKMLHAIAPSLSVVSLQPSTSNNVEVEKVDPALVDAEAELNLRSMNLSSTLQKLYLWEKKLYEEVKIEEKMRILHERKVRKLKRLDERGAEAHKVDATRDLVRSLSTKIRIAIQVVDKISVKINRVRDDELWPRLHEFIQGLTRMWRSMLECHHSQCQAIGEAKRLDAVVSGKYFSEAHIESTSQLKHEAINWTVGFSSWIGAQKDYVRALNNWLVKCLLYVPEETADGIAPFSPGRIGAPPVFVICNQWFQSLDRVSEKEVQDSMRDFASSVLHLWERDKHEMRDRITANKDVEKKIKNLEREDQKIQKEIQALEKQMVMVARDDSSLSLTGHVVYQSDTSKSGSVQASLQRTFEAMERFTANSLRIYEELLQRIEEVLSREPEKVS